ncbi:NADPH:quinone reductase-like Zn-dependent oxidoreductase [Spinactinospora alkalitolerans]|uniref:NADPH:quinone reductase-like Zn-dependent oxidoreductase n=1 Tax=Spinactinospora alkalitolerans TaxID=687207 RepID=A0A852TX21_9ACTN|nr:alcohol dehydrogenase family protein [Spinactinospora alkalitolerans]NYE47925.1 NADPH:quinone reductase-like Zn-dependent oxidoreductase [Spinactinospora alkalitolerans]
MALPDTMAAAVLTGHGGLDKLDYRTDVPVPHPQRGEVLIEVAASAINNTDINTRIGWYSKTVASGTDAGGAAGFTGIAASDATWSGQALTLPRIQGADVCGRIAAVGEGVSAGRIGERVLVRNMVRTYVDYRPFECWTLGSECDGGFAQFTVAPARETHAVDCDWSDAALAAVPCAYSTAENMLHRAGVGAGRVLVTGASGGVGLAAVQLAERRGASVAAVCSPAKADQVLAHGADHTLDRGADLVGALGRGSVDAVIDIVGGPQTARLLELLRPGGSYAVAGAIDGPNVEIDLRTVYLNDLRLLGCTFQDDDVFANLIDYIERGEIHPLVSKTYPLADIARAQQDFLSKKNAGKLVLIPPPPASRNSAAPDEQEAAE